MNSIRYVNFPCLVSSRAVSSGVQHANPNKEVFAGMWLLTVVTKEGYSGYKRLREEDFRNQVKRAISKALAPTTENVEKVR